MHPFMCYIENHGAVHGTICSMYIEHAWYSDLTSRDIQLVFEISDALAMRYLAFAISSNNYEWEVLHVQDKQNNTTASVTIPSTYDGSVKFGIKLYDTPPTVGSVLNVGFDYVITGGIDLASTNVKTVAMTCPTEGATIKYTLDGTDPTEDSTDYIGEIEVEPPVTIKARGFKDNVISSDTATLTFDMLSLPAPVLTTQTDSSGNVYAVLQNVDSYPDDALVYYSHTSSNPLEGAEYMTISAIKNAVIKGAIVVLTVALPTLFVAVSCDGYYDSDTDDVTGTWTAETPVISQDGNNITITCGTAGASIYYTIDGSNPTTASNLYGGAFAILANCTIKAIAVASGYQNSNIASYSATYTPPVCATPTISQSGNTVTFTCATAGATIHYSGCGVSGTVASGGSVSITASGTMTAYATADGYSQSATASKSCTYTQPTFPDFDISYAGNLLWVTCSNAPDGTTFSYVSKVGSITISSGSIPYFGGDRWQVSTGTGLGVTFTVTGSAPGYEARVKSE